MIHYDFDALFPDEISDETAYHMDALLQTFATAFENCFYDKIKKHFNKLENLKKEIWLSQHEHRNTVSNDNDDDPPF